MRNSPAAESSRWAHVSRHPPQNRGETYKLPNQAVGLMLVAIHRSIVDEKLTGFIGLKLVTRPA